MCTLIVLAGLLREFELGLASMHRQIFLPNPGMCFHVALLTSYATITSYKERVQRRHARGALPANGTATIRALLGPNIPVVFEQISESPIPGSICSWDGKLHLAACVGKGMPGGLIYPVNRKPSFEFRVAHGLDQMAKERSLASYRRILAIRPDASLTRPLHIEELCSHHPGVNLIGSSIRRSIDGAMHDRDVDLAYLACDAAGLRIYLFPYLDNNGTTRTAIHFREAYRLQPPEFHSRLRRDHCKPYYGVARYECSSIALMARRKIRLGTLDDADIFVDLLNHPSWCLLDWEANENPSRRRWNEDLHCRNESLDQTALQNFRCFVEWKSHAYSSSWIWNGEVKCGNHTMPRRWISEFCKQPRAHDEIIARLSGHGGGSPISHQNGSRVRVLGKRNPKHHRTHVSSRAL
jgi:hypothetical protein